MRAYPRTALFLTFIAFALAFVSARADLVTGLAAYYPFDENANDASGNGNHGSLNGPTPTTDRFGNSNSAFYFAGSGKYIEVPRSASIEPQQVTVAAWVNPDDMAHWQIVLSKRYAIATPPFNSYVLDTTWSTPPLQWRFCSARGGVQDCIQGPAILTNQWSFLVGTDNGIKKVLYVNGIIVAETPSSGALSYSIMPLYIGSAPTFGEGFKGKIDDVRIYNRALADWEIADLYAGGGLPNSSTMISNVRASQRAGTNIVDIYYDLTSSTATAAVAVSVSTNNGTNFSAPAGSFSGHFGAVVPKGYDRKIAWNAGNDFPGKLINQCKIRLTASTGGSADMVFIPPGGFIMGDSFSEGNTNERPAHSVILSAFYMDRYEVKKSLWATVFSWATNHGYTFGNNIGQGKAANHPVHTVSWYEAVKWCNARSQMENLAPVYYTSAGQSVLYTNGSIDLTNECVKWTANGYRLPTEAEWEKAARGGLNANRFPWGNTISHAQANYFAQSGYAYDLSAGVGYHPSYANGGLPYTSPVGTFFSSANGYGLLDVAGNVFEWCWDRYGPYPSGTQTDPKGTNGGPVRIFRGGSEDDWARNSRVAYRDNNHNASYSEYGLGFRCVRSGSGLGSSSVSSAQSGTFALDARGAVTGSLTARILGANLPLTGAQLKVESVTSLSVTSSVSGNCVISNVLAGSGYVVVASACGYGSVRRTNVTVTVGTTNNLGDINLPIVNGPYRLVSLVPDVNGTNITTVEEGGTAYRYYRFVAADGKTPVSCGTITVRLSGGSPINQSGDVSDNWAGRVAGVPDSDGIVRLRVPASVLTPVDTPRPIEVLVDGVVKSTFTAKSVPKEYEQVWRHKVGVEIGGSVGVVAPLAVSGSNNRSYQTEVRRTMVNDMAVSERIRRLRDTEFRLGLEVTPPGISVLGAGVSTKAGVGALGGLLQYSEYEFDPSTTDPWDNGLKLYLALGDKLTTGTDMTAGLYRHLSDSLEPLFLGDKLRLAGADARLGVYGEAEFTMGWKLGSSAKVGISGEISDELYALAGMERTFDKNGNPEEFSLSLGYGSSLSGSASAGAMLTKDFGGFVQAFAGADGETRGSVVYGNGTETPKRVETVETFGVQGLVGAKLVFGPYFDNPPDDPPILNLGGGLYQEIESSTSLDFSTFNQWETLRNRSKVWKAVSDGGTGLALRPDIQAQLFKGFLDAAAEVNPPSYEFSVYRASKVDTELGGDLLRVTIPAIGHVGLSGELSFSVERGAKDVNEKGRIWQGQKRMPTETAPKITDGMIPTETIVDLEKRWVGNAWEGVLQSAVEVVERIVSSGVNTVLIESATFVFDQALAVGSTVTASHRSNSSQPSAIIGTTANRHLPSTTDTNFNYGIGGIYRFESTNAFVGSGTLQIAYSDADTNGLDEAELRIYRFSEEINRWVLVGGVVNAASNTVTATITNLGTYAVAPPLPTGDVIPLLSTTELQADGVSQMTATITNLVLNTGNAATQEWLFTVVSDGVEILNADAEATLPGIQVVATNTGFVLQLRAPLGGTVAHVSVASVAGDASGSAAINLVDNVAPAAPIGLTPIPGQSRIWVSWQTNAEPDVIGYRVHYRLGQNGPPFDGTAAIEGAASPVSVVTTNVMLRGLARGTNYFVAVSAVDGTGNEGPLSASVPVTTVEGSPLPPTGVAVKFGEDGTNILMWALSEDDGYNDRDVVRYDVWRAVLPGGTYEKIDGLAAGASFYSTTNIPVQTNQYVAYAVSAVDIAALNSSTNQANRVLASGTGLDMDGDQLPDEWETMFNLNPQNPADASLDSDGDGLSNYAEFLAGKNPSLFDNIQFTAYQVLPDGRFQMSVFGELNRTYLLEGCTNLPNWHPLLLFTCTNSPTAVIDQTAAQYQQRFYRVAPLDAMPKPILNFVGALPVTPASAQLSLQALPGFSYRIEISTNLTQWTTLTNLSVTNPISSFSDGNANAAKQRFYRAVVE